MCQMPEDGAEIKSRWIKLDPPPPNRQETDLKLLFAKLEAKVRAPPTTWTILQQDGPNHLGSW